MWFYSNYSRPKIIRGWRISLVGHGYKFLQPCRQQAKISWDCDHIKCNILKFSSSRFLSFFQTFFSYTTWVSQIKVGPTLSTFLDDGNNDQWWKWKKSPPYIRVFNERNSVVEELAWSVGQGIQNMTNLITTKVVKIQYQWLSLFILL